MMRPITNIAAIYIYCSSGKQKCNGQFKAIQEMESMDLVVPEITSVCSQDPEAGWRSNSIASSRGSALVFLVNLLVIHPYINYY